jgi:hypothetical protein
MGAPEMVEDELVTNDEVGISLVPGEEADAIVALVREELGDQVQVTDAQTYVKLETSVGQIEIRLAEVADMLGRRFDLSDFQMIFASYYGRPKITDTMVGVYADMTVGVLEED